MNRFLLTAAAAVAGLMVWSCEEDVPAAGSIYGMISEAGIGTPVSGAEVMLSPGNTASVTGSNGSYEFQNLEPGQYKLIVSAAGYNANYRQVTIRDGESTICDMQLTKEEVVSGMELSTRMLDFGTDYNDLTFDIRNTGTSGSIDWYISNITENWLSVSPSEGSTEMGKSSSIKVMVDRAQISVGETTTFNVNAAGGSVSIIVSVEPGNGSGNPNNPPASEDITSGLYVHYMFEDNFNDASGNNVNGFGSNNPEFVEGVRPGTKAARFQRTQNSFMTVPYPVIDSRNMTVSFWTGGLDDGNIFYMTSSNNDEPMFSLSMNGGSLKFIVKRYNLYYRYDDMKEFSHIGLNDGGWHHVVLVSDFNQTTYAKATTVLYIDGQKMDIAVEDVNPFDEDGGFLSSYGTGIKFFLGGEVQISSSKVLNGANMTIDNFRVYDTRLFNDAEVKVLYESER